MENLKRGEMKFVQWLNFQPQGAAAWRPAAVADVCHLTFEDEILQTRNKSTTQAQTTEAIVKNTHFSFINTVITKTQSKLTQSTMSTNYTTK